MSKASLIWPRYLRCEATVVVFDGREMAKSGTVVELKCDRDRRRIRSGRQRAIALGGEMFPSAAGA